jgi:hypothetical protein
LSHSIYYPIYISNAIFFQIASRDKFNSFFLIFFFNANTLHYAGLLLHQRNQKTKTMNNKLSISNQNAITNPSTGLTVNPNDSFVAKSGFKYLSGVRKIGDLNIVENIANGTGVTFLNGIQIYNNEGVLIAEKKAPHGTHYEREVARQLAKQRLLGILEEANKNNPDFDIIKAEELINEHLKHGYYSKSYQAAKEWYEGLLNQNI